jgi:hypothetical protein
MEWSHCHNSTHAIAGTKRCTARRSVRLRTRTGDHLRAHLQFFIGIYRLNMWPRTWQSKLVSPLSNAYMHINVEGRHHTYCITPHSCVPGAHFYHSPACTSLRNLSAFIAPGLEDHCLAIARLSLARQPFRSSQALAPTACLYSLFL